MRTLESSFRSSLGIHTPARLPGRAHLVDPKNSPKHRKVLKTFCPQECQGTSPTFAKKHPCLVEAIQIALFQVTYIILHQIL